MTEEYRVRWRREGHERASRIYQTAQAAHRKARGIVALEQVKAETTMADMADLAEQPVIESREVGEWAVAELQPEAPTRSDLEGMRDYFARYRDDVGIF